MIRHLYQRSIISKGKKIKAWYYWFYDKNGKQVRKSCGQNGKPCTVKREAQAFIESLPDENKQKITFAEFTKGMFDKDSAYQKKRQLKGYSVLERTIRQKAYLMRCVSEKFGDVDVTELNFESIDNWLIAQNRTNTWRNCVLTVLREVFKELYSNRLISYMPLIQSYKRIDQKEKGILHLTEIKMLFDGTIDDIKNRWHIKKSRFSKEEDYVFAVMCFTMLTTGMRSGEARALTYGQFVRDDAIILNAMLTIDEKRLDHLKKGNSKDKRWRVTVLPARTVEMLKTIRPENPKSEDYVFCLHGRPFRAGDINRHFRFVLLKNGIDVNERNITAHSLRFTYNSLINNKISGEDLRLMMGHVSANMTEYYDKSKAIDHLDTLLLNKGTLDSVFN